MTRPSSCRTCIQRGYSITDKSRPRRSPLPSEHEILTSLHLDPIITCKNDVSHRFSRHGAADRGEDIALLRSRSSSACHRRLALSIPVNRLSLRSSCSRRRRSVDYEGPGKKKQKPNDVDGSFGSGVIRQTKSIPGHKCRSLDSVLNASRQDEPKETGNSEVKTRRSARISREQVSHGNTSGPSTSTSSRRRTTLRSSNWLSDDWTEEDLQEPRKNEKRKSLNELTEKESTRHVLAWSKKAKRRLRIGAKNLDESVETDAEEEEEEEEKEEEEDMLNVPTCEESLDTDRDSGPEASGHEHDDSVKDQHMQDVAVVGSSGLELKIDQDDNQTIKKPLYDSTIPSMQNTVKDEMEGNSGDNNENLNLASKSQGEVKLNIVEGRRCGLCGGNSKGEPPDYLIPENTNEKNGSKGCPTKSHAGYSEWDAFGSEPGWLGPLLGPLNERLGIAGVWVHQECAIWSPEVYFAGVGHLKNIRSALRRGRLLKCSRCSRPGATIGCQLERCPRTYHLPCARFEGCFFDHEKFLMACEEHLHHFLPRLPGQRCRQNSLNLGRIRLKRKLDECKKLAVKSALMDFEAEEKWQEKAGVDEEFLRRERKRLQRDLARNAPIIVGGTEGSMFQDGWEMIAGSGNVIQCMKEMVMLPLMYPEVFENLGVSPPRGVLLHGHPGTGKTLAVKALVGACAKGDRKIAYFARKGADCLGKYAGDAERQLRLLFYLAEKHQPSIIFFDEIDGLAPNRSQHQDQTQKSVVSTLLALMDGVKSRGSVVVIGATNRPDSLDPALRRPGRFDREIYFPLPSFVERTAILSLHTKKWQVPPEDDVISVLASKTAGFAGADLQALCAQAAMNSLRRTISVSDLMDLVEKHGINTVPDFASLNVSLADWAAALEEVSPPCSSRSAKAAVNLVPSAPLPQYMMSALLWPMVKLIISLHQDNRVTLPPLLENVALLVEETLKSALGEHWISSIESFSHGLALKSTLDALEHDLALVFSNAGMVSNQETLPNTTNVAYTGSKFRVMISGNPRSGYDQLSSWLLYGFEGMIEMCNMNLTTMLQEGGGDVVDGLIQILGNVRSKCPCVVYMPQIEIWAIESSEEHGSRQASQYWNVFRQQVDLMASGLNIVYVASIEMQKDEIPEEIVSFFMGTSVNPSLQADSPRPEETLLSKNRSLPCAWIETPIPRMELVFNDAADYYGKLLYKTYLCDPKFQQGPSTVKNTGLEQHSAFTSNLDMGKRLNQEIKTSNEPNDTNRNRDKSFNQEIDIDKITKDDACEHVDTCKNRKDAATFCNGRKGLGIQSQLSVAISMIGYELLYHPQLRELRHATSKLKGGPSFARKKNRKRSSLEHSDGSNSQSDLSDVSEFKGLVAVGLLAYSGSYLRARDIALAVKQVLGLLINKINEKVSLGKSSEQFSHLLHQAAALEDKVFSWAHCLRRHDAALKIPESSEETFPCKGGPLYTRALGEEGGENHSRLVNVSPKKPSSPNSPSRRTTLKRDGSPNSPTLSGLDLSPERAIHSRLDLSRSGGGTHSNVDLSPGRAPTPSTSVASPNRGTPTQSNSSPNRRISSWSNPSPNRSTPSRLNLSPNGETSPRLDLSPKKSSLPCSPDCRSNDKEHERETEAGLAGHENPTRLEELEQGCNDGIKLNRVDSDFLDDSSNLSRPWCSECLDLVRQALNDLFIATWRSRGSEFLLNVAEEVIGSCSSSVSVDVNKILNGFRRNGSSLWSTSAHECVCAVEHTKKDLQNGGIITDINDSRGYNTSSEVFLCLCPIVKAINGLNRHNSTVGLLSSSQNPH